MQRKKRFYKSLFGVNVILKKEVQHFLFLLAAAASAENLASQIKQFFFYYELLLKKTVFTASSIFLAIASLDTFCLARQTQALLEPK